MLERYNQVTKLQSLIHSTVYVAGEKFLSCVKHCIVDMVTFIALVKIFPLTFSAIPR